LVGFRKNNRSFEAVFVEIIFLTGKNKLSNIHMLWKIRLTRATTLDCAGFEDFFTFTELIFENFFWKYQCQSIKKFGPNKQTIFRTFEHYLSQ